VLKSQFSTGAQFSCESQNESPGNVFLRKSSVIIFIAIQFAKLIFGILLHVLFPDKDSQFSSEIQISGDFFAEKYTLVRRDCDLIVIFFVNK